MQSFNDLLSTAKGFAALAASLNARSAADYFVKAICVYAPSKEAEMNQRSIASIRAVLDLTSEFGSELGGLY